VGQTLGPGPWVVKAQIHAGGRGKGGGVKLDRTPDEVCSLTRSMMGMILCTHQTGPEGKIVRKVPVENGHCTDEDLQTVTMTIPEIKTMGKYKYDARYKVISMRVTDEEKSALNELSRGARKSVSTLVREAVLQYIPHVLSKPHMS